MYELSEISISYKPSYKFSERPMVASSYDVSKVFRTAWSDDICYCEEFVILLLSRANRVLGVSRLSRGGIAGTVVDVRNIMQAALMANAASIILCHNHPSGNLKPSQADLNLTRKIKEAASLFDISVLDHLILSDESYLSFADEGLM